jgi:sarcosine oxidase
MRAAVIGAGIVGAAAAFELAERGAEVTVFEGGEPFGARSAGDTRIFRLAHREAALVARAQEARRSWDRWSERAGCPLVGDEGLVVSGGDPGPWSSALREAGEPGEIAERLPEGWCLPRRDGTGPFVVDRGAGAIDLVATRELLLAGATVHREAVNVLDSTGSRARVVTGSCDDRFDAAVLAAGAGTPALAAGVGIDVPAGLRRHSRFTFRLRPPLTRTPCWLDATPGTPLLSSYSHTVAPGRWAIGGELAPEDTAWELGEAEVRRRCREAVTAFVRGWCPLAEPEPVAHVSCEVAVMPVEDGFWLAGEGPVVAGWGNNLAKFAPLLGERLAAAALGEPPD